jgi:hypothetical protein
MPSTNTASGARLRGRRRPRGRRRCRTSRSDLRKGTHAPTRRRPRRCWRPWRTPSRRQQSSESADLAEKCAEPDIEASRAPEGWAAARTDRRFLDRNRHAERAPRRVPGAPVFSRRRWTVIEDTPRFDAISASVKPQKNFSSTICASSGLERVVDRLRRLWLCHLLTGEGVERGQEPAAALLRRLDPHASMASPRIVRTAGEAAARVVEDSPRAVADLRPPLVSERGGAHVIGCPVRRFASCRAPKLAVARRVVTISAACGARAGRAGSRRPTRPRIPCRARKTGRARSTCRTPHRRRSRSPGAGCRGSRSS